jgi:hypothetical protein
MLTTKWIVQEVKYSTIIIREVNKEGPKTDGRTVYKQTLITAKLQIGKKLTTELTGRSPPRWRRSALDCSEEEEEEEEEEGEGEGDGEGEGEGEE